MARFPSVGEDFGAYRVLRQLGRGGMGVVFAAEHRGLGRTVALKVLSPELGAQPDYRTRFAREAGVLARLDSPHVVQVLDHGEHDGCLYIATQYVAGGDLAGALRTHGPVPTAQAAQVAEQLAWALADSHAAGIVHRDVKPSNVLLREVGAEVFAYLCDFGIAQDREPGLTAPGAVAGTFAYLAPERLRGEPATARADLYALGCVLFTALVGAAPYAGSDVEIGMSHLGAPVPQVVEDSPVAASVNAVLRRAMAKDPAARYPDARAMRADLQALSRLAACTLHPPLTPRTPLTGTPSAPVPPSAPSPPVADTPPWPQHTRPVRHRPAAPPPAVPPSAVPPSVAPSVAPSGSRPGATPSWGPPPPAPSTPSAPPPPPPGRAGRRTGLVVAGAVLAVVAIAGGGGLALVAAGSDDGEPSAGGSESTALSTAPTTGVASEPTSEPTVEPTTEPTVEPTSETPTTKPRPQPKPFYPDVAPASGPRMRLGYASLRVPRGWGRVDSGIVEQGVGARDYSDRQGYYSSVFLRRTDPGFEIDSIDLLQIAARSAVEGLDEADDTITLRASKLLRSAWLDGERAARITATYYSTKDRLSFVEETWFVARGPWLYRVTFQHSASDPVADRRAQIDPMVVSFRWG